jgi:hypothetical protein
MKCNARSLPVQDISLQFVWDGLRKFAKTLSPFKIKQSISGGGGEI